MPLIARIPEGTVTGLWGIAYIKSSQGKLKRLELGDRVHLHDQILTTDASIVRISDGKGAHWIPKNAKRTGIIDLDELRSTLEDLNQAAPREATAAGTTAASGDGSLDEGLRIERIIEVVSPLSFEFAGSDRSASTAWHETTPTTDALTARGDAAATDAGRAIDIGVLDNDGAPGARGLHVSAINGVPLSVGVPVDIGTGTVTLLDNGQLRYTPAAGTSGAVQFAYTVTDASGHTAEASVQVQVAPPVLHPPVAAGDSLQASDLHPVVSTNVLANDQDPDHDVLSVTEFTVGGQTHAAGSTVVIDGIGRLSLDAHGELRFEAEPGYFGPVPTLVYTVTDGHATATAPVEIAVAKLVDLPPEAVPTPAQGVEGTTIAVHLGGTDADGSVIQVQIAELPPSSAGTLYLPDGVTPVQAMQLLDPATAAQLVFVPTPGFTGPTSLQFLVIDNEHVASAPTLQPITVTPAVEPSLRIDDVQVNEAAGTATFTVTLDQATTVPVSVHFQTQNGTAGAQDFGASQGTLVFGPGTTTQTITVSITNDAVFEGAEQFSVQLSQAQRGVIADALGVGTITDDGTGAGGNDDDTPALAVSSVSVAEDAGHAVFTVSLSAPSAHPTTVNLALGAGTATEGSDYGSALEVSTDGGLSWTAATTATFAPGATSVLVRTPVVDDNISEPSEAFSLTATTTSGTTSNASASGVATLIDNETAPTLSLAGPGVVNEAAGTVTYTVTLSHPSSSTVTVNVDTVDGTAQAGQDYDAVQGLVVFSPGQTSQTVTVAIRNDAVFEGSESFQLVLSNPGNAILGTGSSVGTAIVDNGTGTGGTDNDTPSLSVSSVSVAEDAGYAVFTVSLSNPSSTATPVNLALSAGSATAGADYTSALQVSTDGGATWTAATAATFAPGATSVLVRTPIVNDTLAESTESFTLTASTATGAPFSGSASGAASITDNDTPAFSINDVVVNEGAGTATFTLTLSNPSASALSVNWATASGSAVAGADFTAASGTVTFAANQTTATVTVPVLQDSVFEGSETFNVNLSGATGGAVIADASGLGTIRDDGTGSGGTDNDTPALAVSSVSVAEDAGYAVFNVSLSNPSASATSVNLALSAGSATAGTDYTGALQVSTDGGATWTAATSATFAPGATSVLVRTPVVNDNITEPSETFSLTATTSAGTTSNASASGIATIVDNEAAPVVSITGPAVVNEAAGTVTYTVSLSNPSASAVSVNYGTVGGTATAGSDFTAASGTLSFAPGETTKTVTVAISNDTVYEGSESFSLALTAPTNATLGTGSSVSTAIVDNGTGAGGTDNDTPALAVSSVSVAEDAGYAVFNVSLSNPSASATSVNLALSAGTATAGADYTTALQVSTDGGATWTAATAATFAPGATSVLVRTPVVNDTIDENNESFSLTATTASGTTSNASASGTATIVDNDAAPTVNIAGPALVNEAAGTVTYTVSLSSASGLPVSVNYGTVAGTAAAGSDFTAASGTLNFAPGETTKTVTVAISNDTVYEGSESFSLALSAPSNATLGTGSSVSTAIVDNGTGTGGTDNDTPTLAVSSVSVAENAGYAVFTVSLSNPAAAATSVNLALNAGTATAGADYTTALQVSTDGGSTWTAATAATFAPGATSVLVRTPIVDDNLGEAAESFSLVATTVSGTTANASATGTATIAANDTPAFSINDVSVNEGAGTVTFTVSLSNPSALTTSVNYASASGSATEGSDYTGVSGNLSFGPGITSRTVTIAISEDTLTESSETFVLNLSGAINATIADAQGVGTIVDNDTPPAGRDLTVTLAEDGTLVLGPTHFLMNDVEQGSNVTPDAVRIDTLPANGSLFLNGVLVVAGQVVSAADLASGALTFQPAPEANGTAYANFSFSVRDASGLYDTVPNVLTVNVTPVNDGAPLAGNDAFVTTLGTPITFTVAQLLANDALPDHAHITSLSAVSSGTLVNNGNGTYTYTPTATGTASFSYTLTDDDGQTSTATVAIQTVSAKDDLATVNESALVNGSGGGTTTAIGNLLANDGSGTSITSVNGITDGSAQDTDSRAGYIGVTTAQGKLVVDSAGTGAGDYTYTLNSAVSNGTGANNAGITEVFNYVSNTSSAALRVTVVDDQPTAYNHVVQISEDALPSYNLVLVLDVSGSMTMATAGGEVQQLNADGSITITTRLAMAKAAMASLVSEYFNQAQGVSITLVTFSNSASIINPGAPYTDKDSAIAAINGLTGSGGTNYESALTAVQTAFGTVNPALQNSVYFISDGEPSVGNTTNPATTTGYTSFVANNNIDSFAVGIGTGIANTAPLNAIHNVDADGNGVSDGAIIVPDLNELSASLLATVPVAYGGNVVNTGDLGSAFGADGGHVQTVTLMLDSNGDGTPDTNVTFTYDAVNHQITQNSGFLSGFPASGDLLTLGSGQGFGLGTLTFNFSTGQYTYFTGGHASQGDSFTFTFVAQDNDGDVTAPATLTLQIADGHPVARPDTDTVMLNQTHASGNVISGLGTDGGTALGSQLTTFAAGGGGADDAVDQAQVSSVSYQGQTFDLTTNSSGSGAGYTYTVSAGQLNVTGSDGSALVFNRSGFYDYTAPTAARPVANVGTAQTVTFTAAPAAATGVTLEGYSRTGTAQALTYSNPAGTTSDGVGVNGGGSNANVDNLETLAVNFIGSAHPNGVANVSFVVASAASNLGSSGGVVSSLTYTVYDVAGHEIGQFYSTAEGTVTVPSDFTNIGRIEIDANSAASARITSVSFADVLTNTTATAIAPVQVGYTLTDTDGDTSSSTLTLRTIQNQLFGDSTDNTVNGTQANDRIVGGAGNDSLNGGAGNDILEGGTGNDILVGGDGADELRGGAGNDNLQGGLGNDVIVGGAGNDTLSGGAGSDVFRWEFADRGAAGTPAVDTVVDFDASPVASGGDVLDLRDLLQGETTQGAAAGNLQSFLHFTQAGTDTILQVSAHGGYSGGFNAGATDQTVLLQGLDLTHGGTWTDQQIISDLVKNGKLLVDQ